MFQLVQQKSMKKIPKNRILYRSIIDNVLSGSINASLVVWTTKQSRKKRLSYIRIKGKMKKRIMPTFKKN